MAKRRTRSNGIPAPVVWTGRVLLFVLAVGGGYAWRSYAPLPIPGEGPLSGDTKRVEVVSKPAPQPKPTPTPAPSAADTEARRALEARARSAEAEVTRLRREMDEIARRQTQTEEQIADIQIKSVLGGAQ